LKKLSKVRKYLIKLKELIIQFGEQNNDDLQIILHYIAIIEIESRNFNECKRMCHKGLVSYSKDNGIHWIWLAVLGILHSRTNNQIEAIRCAWAVFSKIKISNWPMEMLKRIILQHYGVTICPRMLSLIRRSQLFTWPNNKDEGKLRNIPLQQEFEEFYKSIEGMQYQQHIRSYLFKKRLRKLIIQNTFVKDWLVSKRQMEFEMQVHMMQSGDARGAARNIRYLIPTMKRDVEFAP
jgi:hypothetical protein